jgi:hypothetical protein
MRLFKKDIGRKVTVAWDDTGNIDCLLVSVDLKHGFAEVFDRTTNCIHGIYFDQVKAKGNYLEMSKL